VADTGLPWELPYPLPTDLVRDGADDIKALAEATADGLDAAGGLVAVKHALFTTQESLSIASGADEAITALKITHAVADDANRVILSYVVHGIRGTNIATLYSRLKADTTVIGAGTPDGNRPGLNSFLFATNDAQGATLNTAQVVHTPGDTSSVDYQVFLFNAAGSTQTYHVNRTGDNSNLLSNPVLASSLILMEVKV
jgi:hypothetical protein